MLSIQLDLCKQFINTLLSLNVSYIDNTPSAVAAFTEEACPELLETFMDKIAFTQYILGLDTQRIYHLTDKGLINYMILKFNEGNNLMIVGPYLAEQPTPAFCEKVLNTNHLPISLLIPISLYYHSLPICQNSTVISSIKISAMQIFDKTTQLPYTHDILFNQTAPTHLTYVPDDNKEFMMKLLQERYDAENKLLLEIHHGNLDEALLAHRDFKKKSKGITRSNDPIKSVKILSYISNTLFRKAAERAAVHPIYIDILSSQIAHLIENANSLASLEDLQVQMVKDYCYLVKKHTLKDYSPLIRKAINYINVNLSTELHLKTIAEAIDVSPNYLSNLFNKETQQSITRFIHSKRIDKAAELLQSAELSIQTIAFYVGYSDMNYFTKLFKKQTGMTPTHFKSQIRK
ncbi:MAG: AraC family transcriptional regulator [Cellulosilyticaceae bacterium]